MSIGVYRMRNSICVRIIFCTLCIISNLLQIEAKPAEIDRFDVTSKMHEIMKIHASFKKMTPMIAQRGLETYIDTFDPMHCYFLEGEVTSFQDMDEKDLEAIVRDFEASEFPEFRKIFELAKTAVIRRDTIEEKLEKEDMSLPTGVQAKEFKDLSWCKTEEELTERLRRLRALQLDMASKIGKDARELAISRLKKRRLKAQEELFHPDSSYQDKLFCTGVLKAFASSLDTHTNYFTPAEANQFLIAVQQRLFGIGVQMRDDVNGFSIVKMIEGGPAAQTKELKPKDKIIAIDGEPVVGMDLIEVVELIRGQEGTEVLLRVVREIGEGSQKLQELKDVKVPRGEVVLKETRLETALEPFGTGVIAHLKLHSFYQDSDSSSAQDLTQALQEIQKQHRIDGVVLDLRFNSGGVLSQAVQVTGMFMKKGIVVSIKDENSVVHHLRDFESDQMWDGPLVVLTNAGSASAAEIVAGTLKDWGRAIVVGDKHTFGKGSFQTFTLTTTSAGDIDPKGEYKVTQGCYYTVSGNSPQLVGVQADIHVPSGLESMEYGEMYAKYPLETAPIAANFEDKLTDLPLLQREKIRRFYYRDLQLPESEWKALLPQLQMNSELRQKENKSYQKYLQKFQETESDEADSEGEGMEKYPDFQLTEGMSVMKDMIILDGR